MLEIKIKSLQINIKKKIQIILINLALIASLIKNYSIKILEIILIMTLVKIIQSLN